ncbi:MAG: ribosome biogenesis GTPase YlqF [Candidatus Improbicoccus pseudotrichonymphae]|uniref:Ribosome biogenesis GTPase A n=1 Tax=Candidatus Improbicoccus pseudotrichonymphae TaxID=3033792 RepID=A0AA48KVR8_9FIRM|nr:MAG: ribosome biogenesis GTPase YlqF [Candidatus Improbicoccus pseudotrichonymphae]
MALKWYPGHMSKTKHDIENTKIVDAIVEVLDARAPSSSRGVFLNKFNKPIVLVLNKSDLACDILSKEWSVFFKNQNFEVLTAVSNLKSIRNRLLISLRKICRRNEIKSKFNKAFRVIVVGVPNSGKSSFINNILGKKRVKTENRPGVTLKNSWHVLDNELEICDTPGVLSPKINDDTEFKLNVLGVIKNTLYDREILALKLIDFLKRNEFLNDFLVNIFKNPDVLNLESNLILTKFAISRNLISPGGAENINLASEIFLNDFKKGKFGKITLETVT